MTIYRYSDAPLIERIEIHVPHPGMGEATIVARENAEPEKLEALRRALGARHFSTLMNTTDGKPSIEVRGFKEGSALIRALEKLNAVHGAAQATGDDGHHVHDNFRERVRGKALYLSALFYDLGNVSLMASGLQRARHNPSGRATRNDISEIATGAAFSVGDVLLTHYGAAGSDDELKVAERALKRHLNTKGIRIGGQEALSPDTLQEQGTLKAVDSWLRRHIIQVKCLSETAGGLFMVYSAMKRDEKGRHNQPKVAAGLLIATAWLTTMMLDKKEPGAEILEGNTPPPTTLKDDIENNPRAWIARPFAMGNNLLNLWGAGMGQHGERHRFQQRYQDALTDHAAGRIDATQLGRAKAGQHDFLWNIFTACSFLIAHTLFGISGEKRPTDTEDDKHVMNDMVLLSANVLARQPAEVRARAIGDTAEFVSTLSHIHATPVEIAQQISDKLAAIAHSSWAGRVAQGPAPDAPSRA